MAVLHQRQASLPFPELGSGPVLSPGPRWLGGALAPNCRQPTHPQATTEPLGSEDALGPLSAICPLH